ncbi:hypothetical protein [Parasphingorhabdus litoris]|uniref:hypothetical protein n=1 Tax=Parasphingorhabdus litoris TaxID=394733 RepID=UPI0031E1563A
MPTLTPAAASNLEIASTSWKIMWLETQIQFLRWFQNHATIGAATWCFEYVLIHCATAWRAEKSFPLCCSFWLTSEEI